MTTVVGNFLKLESTISANSVVEYHLPLSDERVALNPLIGQEISLKFTGRIHCIDSGELIKKSYGQGYSYKSFITLAQCDMCIVKPELCHYAQGTCREPQWGLDNCLQPHVIYLSETSAPKVGITRLKNIPTRWVDQGALQAIELFRVGTRLDAGLHEVEISKMMSDKTDWRKMLVKTQSEHDLVALKKEIMGKFQEMMSTMPPVLSLSSDEVKKIIYPGEPATKLASLSFDKNPLVKSTLLGIKGQYLIFKEGVLNIRKFQGYEIEFSS